MNIIERNRSEILNYLSWVFLPLILFWKYIILFVHGGYAYHELNPVNILQILAVSFLICYPVIQSYWAYKNPFARIKDGSLVICPRPFDKDIIKIHDIKKVRESLTRGKEKVFNFNYEYTRWVLMIDLSNTMTITMPLDQKKRESLITLLIDNNIIVESV